MNEFKLTKGPVNIAIRDQDGKKTKQEIQGYNFTWEGIEFNAHKDHNSGLFWNITECSSGLSIINSATTRKDALIRFKTRVVKLGSEKVREYIQLNRQRLNV